ncbi:MAG TPA: efflux RND transporter periplasmic adaptor subunit [Kofleriaceae bacterium]|nr:efflux RND transporter periplasmic adaptor subunit [Kofleriaceae bacterium]
MRTYSLLTLSFLAAAACGKSAANTSDAAAEPLVKVPLATVESLSAPQLLEVTGSIKPDQQSKVASDIAGRAIAVMVDSGSRVKQGDPLIRLDTSNAQINSQEVNAQLEAARAQWNMAQTDCQRAKELLDKGAITKQQYDRETTNCTAAQQNVAAIAARARQAGKSITDGVVRAPFTGVVQAKMVEVGEWVAPGMPVVQLIDDDPLKVDISVPESAAPYVKEGLDVELDAVAYPKDKFHAKVTKVGVALNQMPRALVCEATVDPGSPLKSGMFVTVKVTLGMQPMPVVPKSALAQRGTTWRLWVVVKGHLEERVVQLGPELAGGKVAIADGVKAGDKVAAQVTEQVADGARVE